MSEVGQLPSVVAHETEDVTREAASDADDKGDDVTHEEDDEAVGRDDDVVDEEKREAAPHVNGVEHKDDDTETNETSASLNGVNKDSEKEETQPEDQNISELTLKKEVRRLYEAKTNKQVLIVLLAAGTETPPIQKAGGALLRAQVQQGKSGRVRQV